MKLQDCGAQRRNWIGKPLLMRSTGGVKEQVLQQKPRRKVRRTNLPATCWPGCTLPGAADYGQELRLSQKVRPFCKFVLARVWARRTRRMGPASDCKGKFMDEGKVLRQCTGPAREDRSPGHVLARDKALTQSYFLLRWRR